MKNQIIYGLVFLFMITSVFSALDDDIVLYYSFDNVNLSGSVIGDLTGNGLNGSNYGATTGATGRIGQAFSFDGVNDYARISDTSITYTDGFSFSFWAKPTNTSGSNRRLLFLTESNQVQSSVNDGTFGTGYCVALFNGSWNPICDGSYSNTWTHYVYSFDGTNAILYKNGYLANQTVFSGTLSTASSVNEIASSTNDYQGLFDEFGLWDRNVSSDEVTQLFNGGSGSQYPFGLSIIAQVDTQYNLENISINVSTNKETNLTYSLDNGPMILLWNNTNTSTLNLSNLNFTSHSLDFFAYNSTYNVSINKTFEIKQQYFSFQSSEGGGLLSSFSFGNYDSVGNYVSIPLSQLNIGSNTLEFNKPGFSPENFTFTLNSSSYLNETYNVSPVRLYIKMFDSVNYSQLYFNATILNSSSNQVFYNQYNLSELYNETLTGDIEIRITSNGYSPARYYNTLTENSSVTILGYLTQINDSDVVTFNVKDFVSDAALENLTIEARKLINGSSITVSQSRTDSSGNAFMYLDSDQEFEFVFTLSGYIAQSIQSIPGTTSYTIRMRKVVEEFGFINGVTSKITPKGTLLYNGYNYTFSGFVSGTGISFINFSIKDQNDTYLYNSSSTNPTGSSFSYDLNLPTNQTNYTSLLVSLNYIQDGTIYPSNINYSILQINTSSPIAILQNIGQDRSEEGAFTKWLIMVVVIGSVLTTLGSTAFNLGGISLLPVPILIFFVFVGWIPFFLAIGLSFYAIIMFLSGGNKI